MKKYNVFKVLLIALFVAIICSFLIPQSKVGYTGIEKGMINPITFIDSVSNGLTSFSVFIASFVYIISIGIFYSVLKKSGKYDVVINNTAFKFKNRKKAFLIISILTLGFLTAVIGDVMPALIFVPAFIDIARKLGFDSKKAILSTVGAVIIGSANSLYTNYTNQILATTVSTNIIVKVIALFVSFIVLVLFAIFGKKPEEVKLEKENVKKGSLISIAFDIILVLIIIGMVNWKAYFGFEGFSKFHTSVIEFKLFKISVFNALLGTSLVAFGEWTIYSLIVLLIVVSVILALIYKVGFDGLFESISNGVRKSLPYAMILILANVILVGVYNSGFFITIISSIAKMKDQVLSCTTISALSALVYPDYTYANQFTLSTLSILVTKKALFSVFAITFQLIYSLMLLISPTSVLVLMALRYEDVRYKDWFKYIYKLFLGLLIIFFMIIMIVGGKYIRTVSYIVLAVLIVILVLFVVLCLTKKNVKVEAKKETAKKKNSKKK